MAEPEPEYLIGRDLKARGWTDGLIARFLPEPDRTARNLHHASGPPMRLYAVARVEQVEASPDFQAVQQTTGRRKAAAARAVETKRATMSRRVDGMAMDVRVLDRDALIAAACRQYNQRQDDRLMEGRPASDQPAGPDSDPRFLDRIAVNYLRHHLTRYEERLSEIAGKVGATDAYQGIRAKVFAAIREQYPWLADECDRQETRG